MRTNRQNKVYNLWFLDFLSFMSKYLKLDNFLRPHFFVTISVFILTFALFAKEINVKTKIKELKHKDAKVRMIAVKELAKAGKDKMVAKALIDTVKTEKDASVRNAIYETLGNLGEKEAVNILLEKVKTEKVKDIRPMLVLSVGKLQDDTAVPVLKEVFLDENEDIEVRLQAANALSYIPSESAVYALIEGLNSKNPKIRLQAVCSLFSYSSDVLSEKRIQIIKQQAEVDPDEENRKFIKEKILTKPKE